MKKEIVFLLALAVGFCANEFAVGQIGSLLTGDVRVAGDFSALPDGGQVGDENGGFTSLIVGINDPGGGVPGVMNWALLGFDTTPAAGETVTGATLTINVQTGFGGGSNHGTVDDTLSIHEVFASNAGWDPGTGTIQNNATNVHAGGGVTFRFQSQTSDPATSVAWKDAAGSDLDNFLGSYDTNSVGNSVTGWVSGSAPDEIVFTFDAATAQQWVDGGFIDLVVQVNDDGSNTSRFNLSNGSPTLVFDVPSTVLLGDIDLSGTVDFADIGPFINLLSSSGFQLEADMDLNMIVDFADIAPFIAALSGP